MIELLGVGFFMWLAVIVASTQITHEIRVRNLRRQERWDLEDLERWYVDDDDDFLWPIERSSRTYVSPEDLYRAPIRTDGTTPLLTPEKFRREDAEARRAAQSYLALVLIAAAVTFLAAALHAALA